MLDFKTVYECNCCLGCKTLHPQVSIINLESPNLEQDAVKFEFYAILLIEECPDSCCCCGRKYYDYSNATMVFLTPGEIFRMSENNTLPNKGYLLAFHPDLLFRTSLNNHIKNYTFFSYKKEEALHLSQRETAKITCCLENIEDELHHPIDTPFCPFHLIRRQRVNGRRIGMPQMLPVEVINTLFISHNPPPLFVFYLLPLSNPASSANLPR